MEFHELGKRERKLLLDALDINTDTLRCQCCGKKVTYDKCGIFLPTGTDGHTTILCSSPLCISKYLTLLEAEESKRLAKEKMLKCSHCGKPFMPAEDPKTGKLSKYVWKPDCGCLGKNFRVSLG